VPVLRRGELIVQPEGHAVAGRLRGGWKNALGGTVYRRELALEIRLDAVGVVERDRKARSRQARTLSAKYEEEK